MGRSMALTVALLLTFLGTVRTGFLEGDCVLTYPNGNDVDYVEWIYDLFLHPAVPDTALPGLEIARFSTRNIQRITNRQSKYVKPELKDGYLVLTLHEDFVHFEEWETEPDLKVNLDFQCKDGTARISMWGQVEDSNNHSPEFLGEQPFTYTLPLPFPPAIPLSCVTNVVVSAIDIDLSTTRVDFEIVGSDVIQVKGTWKVGRVFYANITTARYITAPLTAAITAKDNGVPLQTTTASLSVVADVARSLVAPAAPPTPGAPTDLSEKPTPQTKSH